MNESRTQRLKVSGKLVASYSVGVIVFRVTCEVRVITPPQFDFSLCCGDMSGKYQSILKSSFVHKNFTKA